MVFYCVSLPCLDTMLQWWSEVCVEVTLAHGWFTNSCNAKKSLDSKATFSKFIYWRQNLHKTRPECEKSSRTYRLWDESLPVDWPVHHNSRGQTPDICQDWSTAPSAGQRAHWSGSHCTPPRWGSGGFSCELLPDGITESNITLSFFFKSGLNSIFSKSS